MPNIKKLKTKCVQDGIELSIEEKLEIMRELLEKNDPGHIIVSIFDDVPKINVSTMIADEVLI